MGNVRTPAVLTPGPACAGKRLKTSHWLLPSLSHRELLKREREQHTRPPGARGGPARGRVAARSRESQRPRLPRPRAGPRARRSPFPDTGDEGPDARRARRRDLSRLGSLRHRQKPGRTYVVRLPLQVTFLKQSQDNNLMSLKSIPLLPYAFYS